MYYALIMLSVVMFGCCFKLSQTYTRLCGSGFFITLKYLFITSISNIIILLIINGFKFEFTLFTLIIAVFSSVNSFLFVFCGLKSLGSINLSLYSLFSMLGGMLLPFLQGLIFYNEPITIAKIICLCFIIISLSLTLKKDRKNNKAIIYYLGIFIFNGMSGVLSKLFVSSQYPKTSATGYSLVCALCSFVISGVLIFIFRRKIKKTSVLSTVVNSFDAIFNRIANLLLLISLTHIEASLQYPLVTGGVIIVSTIISFFSNNKPSKCEILSVITAFISMLCLFIIPI